MNTNTNISLDQLTPAQFAALRTQLKAQSAVKRKSARSRWEVIDAMLHAKDGTGFKHTTSEIVAALQAKSLLPSTLDAEARAEALKMVQTRKQKLLKLCDKDGKLVHAPGTIGFKQSASGVGPLTVERVLAWMATATKEQLAAIAKAAK